MITITITSDVPLTDPRFESLLKAASEISESMGESVEYLDANSLSTISSASSLHKNMRKALASKEQAHE